MLRKLWVLIWPLIRSLLACLGALIAISLVTLVLYFAFGGGFGEEGAIVWRRTRPSIVVGAYLFAALAVLAWALYLVGLYRKLKERDISLQEYSSWSAQQRSTWLKDDGQTQRG